MREFAEWAGQEIEKVCERNDKPRPGKPAKPAWERLDPGTLYRKIDSEVMEMIDAYINFRIEKSQKNIEHLQWECADVAATCMMLSARLAPVMSVLHRGRVA